MTFNTELIQGLWRIRNDDRYEIRDWLRQCIRLEKKRRQ